MQTIYSHEALSLPHASSALAAAQCDRHCDPISQGQKLRLREVEQLAQDHPERKQQHVDLNSGLGKSHFPCPHAPGRLTQEGKRAGRRQEEPMPDLRAEILGLKLKLQRFRPDSRWWQMGVCIHSHAALCMFKTGHTWPQVRLKHHLPRQLIYFHPPAVLSSSSNLSPPFVLPATALRDSCDWQVPIYRPPTSLLRAGPRRGLEPPPCTQNQINTEVFSKHQVCAQCLMQNKLNSIR